jgi:acyl-CoA thioesterase-1
VLFIGTSLTAGLGLDPDSAYPQLIQEKIEAAHLPFEVVNAGVSGETTAGLLRRLDWLLRGNFDVVVVESGANDGLRGTPVATVRQNLKEIISGIRSAHPAARVMLVQMEAPPNLGAAYTTAFHALYVDVARETGATLMPFLLQGVAGDRSLNQGDGIHPNQRGEHIVADNVWRSLEPTLRGAME